MPRIMMIASASVRDIANQLGEQFQAGETFTAMLSATGTLPATHYIAEGEIPVEILEQIQSAASELLNSGEVTMHDLASTTKADVLTVRGLQPCRTEGS